MNDECIDIQSQSLETSDPWSMLSMFLSSYDARCLLCAWLFVLLSFLHDNVIPAELLQMSVAPHIGMDQMDPKDFFSLTGQKKIIDRTPHSV